MKDEKGINLEQAMVEVEEILKKLERKDLSLEEHLKLFEKGLELIHICEEKLKIARLKVEAVIEKGEKLETVSLEEARRYIKDERNA